MGKRQSLSEYANARNVSSRIQDHDFRADEGRIKLSPRAFSLAPWQIQQRGGVLPLPFVLGPKKKFFQIADCVFIPK